MGPKTQKKNSLWNTSHRLPPQPTHLVPFLPLVELLHVLLVLEPRGHVELVLGAYRDEVLGDEQLPLDQPPESPEVKDPMVPGVDESKERTGRAS